MVENPTKFVSSIVGLVCLKPDEQYDHRHANSYSYETIGGSNSRIAVQELAEGNPNNPNYKTRFVAVYAHLTNEDTLRLAAKHNRATLFTHEMTTQDKIFMNVCTAIVTDVGLIMIYLHAVFMSMLLQSTVVLCTSGNNHFHKINGDVGTVGW